MIEYIKREDALKIADEFYDHPIGKDIAMSLRFVIARCAGGS